MQTTFTVHDMLPKPDVKVRGEKHNFWISLETPWEDNTSPQVEVTLFFKSQENQRLFMQHVAEAFLKALESRPIVEPPPPPADLNDEIPY
jgi:hypothetical protein